MAVDNVKESRRRYGHRRCCALEQRIGNIGPDTEIERLIMPGITEIAD